ncbi:putative DNA helicase [Medicago truncatula]|uniref:Putative DNA helicase n=1 Tax=Medicago truncatula TaxID=3880 RepID=A0A396JD02_MEDTR|nr:uncharacterized protein LOC112419343 [Medicago truncatula]RHN73037.1 putative DNA helicase [Medicago truncatula]
MAYTVTDLGRGRYENLRTYHVYIHESQINFEVTVTATASVVTNWLQSMLNHHFQSLRHLQYLRRNRNLCNRNLIVGLGVQWTPGNLDPPADTLQLCISGSCLIFHLSLADMIPVSLCNFLRHPKNTFVGFWNAADRRRLERFDHRLQMWKDPQDLRHYRFNGENLSRESINVIVRNWLDFEVDQSVQVGRSNWNAENLYEDQIAYASIDAYCAFSIGIRVQAWRYR